MENVYFYVSIAAFVLAAVLAIAAVVIFVKMDVINAIRFLQGKRVPTSSSSSRHPARGARRSSGKAVGNGAAARKGAVLAGEGDDRVTDIAHEGPEGDDNLTTVVAPIQDEPASARASKAKAAAAEPSRNEDELDDGLDEGFEGSETPTEVLTEEDMDSERPTGVLAEDEDDSERPTGVLVEEEEESERPTGVLAEEEEESERPTGLLSEEDEESERETGLLDETDESERSTDLLDEAGEASEQETGVLDEAGVASEMQTDVLTGGNKCENETPASVVQQDEDGFRFILKQNVIVVHTDESLD